MEFSIQTKGPDEVFITDGLPPELSFYEMKGAEALGAFGAFGRMSFQQIKGDGFAVWYSNYFIDRDTSFTAGADQPVLELHFIFSRPVEYFLEGIGKSELLNGQFNITYTPYILNKVFLAGGTQFYTFDIHFEATFLEKFAASSPELSSLLEDVVTHTPANITKDAHFATGEMISLINSMLKNKYHGIYREFFIESQVVLLLLQVLEKINADEAGSGMLKLTASDVERIVAARDYLILHMDNPVSVIKLARIAGINDFKLKKGFKQLFGNTIFRYLEEARLEKAMFLLRETDRPVADIGYFLGYMYPTHFSAVFKKKFGYPPGYFKK